MQGEGEGEMRIWGGTGGVQGAAYLADVTAWG